MLIQRLLTAMVLIGLLLPALYLLPAPGWLAICTILVGTAAVEWARLGGVAASPARGAYAALVCGLTVWISLLPALQTGWNVAAALFWLLLAPWLLARAELPRHPLFMLSLGLIILTAAGGAMSSLRNVSPTLLLALMAIIWISDTSAYFAGRAFGRHKLAPRVSPGKTWEGVAGALTAVLLYAVLCITWMPDLVIPKWLDTANAAAILAGYWLILAALGVTGDLVESLMKRSAGVKDSGTILPGHGGILDRVDALLPMLPLAALFYLR